MRAPVRAAFRFPNNMKLNRSPSPCVSCNMIVNFDHTSLEKKLIDTIRTASPSVSLNSAHAAAQLLLPTEKKFYQGPRVCLSCLALICSLAPCKPAKTYPIHPRETSRPKHFWCGTCDVLQYNWPLSKGFRLSLKDPTRYECRSCNGVHTRNRKLLVKLFELINPDAVGSAKQFVAYRQEHRICSTLNCRQVAQVIDHRTSNPYCLEHFKSIDSSISPPPAIVAPLGLLELADEACKANPSIECSNIFSPFPSGVDNDATYARLDSLFNTSWDLFYNVKS